MCCRFLCPENSEATKRILKGVRDAYGGREKCPFSKAEIEGKFFLTDCVYQNE